jgi:lysophospholipase L1-like esterase
MPSPSAPVETFDVAVRVFYDQNENGRIDAEEVVRLGGVEVEVGSRRAATEERTGTAVVSGVPRGSASASVRPQSLPPYFVAPPAVALDVPQAMGTMLDLPVTLPIGNNRPNRYLAFGDSITAGDGSRDGNGYRDTLARGLESLWGAASIVVDADSGSMTDDGADRIGGALAQRRPAYTLILYGTNDWNACKGEVPCFTLDNVRAMVGAARSVRSLPVLATIPPANPAFPDKVPPERNQWVHAIDDLLRGLARDEGIALADVEAAFLQQPSLEDLLADHVHPNDDGYRIIADVFLRAITEPRGSGSGGFDSGDSSAFLDQDARGPRAGLLRPPAEPRGERRR